MYVSGSLIAFMVVYWVVSEMLSRGPTRVMLGKPTKRAQEYDRRWFACSDLREKAARLQSQGKHMEAVAVDSEIEAIMHAEEEN